MKQSMEQNGREPSGKFAAGHKGFKKKGSYLAHNTKVQVAEFVTEIYKDLSGMYKDLTPKDKLKLFLGLLEYVIPKQRENLVQVEDNTQPIDLTKLSEKALTEILSLQETTENGN